MSIETVIRAYLLTDATLTGYIATRLYWQYSPQENVRPYVVYYTVSDTDTKTMVGKDGSNPVLTFRIVATLGEDGAAAQIVGIAEAIRSKIMDFTGLITGTNVYIIEPVNKIDFPPDKENNCLERYCDYRIIYER